MTDSYLLADVPIKITSVHEEIHAMCADYRTDQTASIHICTQESDIEREMCLNEKQWLADGFTPSSFPPAYIETLAVYRKIAHELLSLGILLMHGSVIAVDGQAYLFTAKSGTGKSTHVRLWREMFGDRAIMVNDDKPLIRVSKAQADGTAPQIIVYGTPWDGKHHLSNNISMPLKAIIRLERGEENSIQQVAPAYMLQTFMQQTYIPPTPTGPMQALSLINDIGKSVKFYLLHCNMLPEAAKIAYEGMR